MMSDTATIATGTDLPAAGTYTLDTAHSEVGFQVRHLMSKVRGRFGSFSGTVAIADEPLESSVEVSIDTASIETGDATRDGHLRSADFLATEEFPAMTFRSTAVRVAGRNRYDVDGELTIRDITGPVTLSVVYEGTATDPWGHTKAGFSAETEIDREAWGLTWNQVLETGGVLVGKKVRIQLEIQAARS
jgi:polyisoprenoid-binding protein YceI